MRILMERPYQCSSADTKSVQQLTLESFAKTRETHFSLLHFITERRKEKIFFSLLLPFIITHRTHHKLTLYYTLLSTNSLYFRLCYVVLHFIAP